MDAASLKRWRTNMHHFLTAAGLLALIGFAFGANAARAVAAFVVIAIVLGFAAIVFVGLHGPFN
jgi:hypothetical protein